MPTQVSRSTVAVIAGGAVRVAAVTVITGSASPSQTTVIRSPSMGVLLTVMP